MNLLCNIDRKVDPGMMPGVALRGKRLFEPTPPRHEQKQLVPMRSAGAYRPILSCARLSGKGPMAEPSTTAAMVTPLISLRYLRPYSHPYVVL